MPIANAYAIHGERTVLVDTGTPGNARRILGRLERHGIRPHDVSLILLTHGHLDHFGSALELRDLTGAPIAIHADDAGALRSGHNPPLTPINATARCMAPFFQRHVTPFEPDLLVDDGQQLGAFGAAGRVISTPGHTPGSVSVWLPTGELIAGDLLMGGYLGGYVLSAVPGYPYFLDDLQQTRQSIRKISELAITKVYVGHGGPLRPDAIRKRFTRNG
jgi:hydroxyacylglutathione hydrolase